QPAGLSAFAQEPAPRSVNRMSSRDAPGAGSGRLPRHWWRENVMTGSRPLLILFGLLGVVSAAAPARPGAPPPQSIPPGEWPAYGRDTWSTKYSPLAQIDRTNVAQLRVAWRWDSPDNALARKDSEDSPGPNESTPIMVDGVLYIPTGLNQVAAIDARTGKTRWVFNPHSHGYVHRGVALWEGPRRNGERERRILMTTKDAYLIALDAATGRPVPSFGGGGRPRPAKGPGAARQWKSGLHPPPAGRLRRRDRLRGFRRRLQRPEGDAARGRARLRRPHRPPALDLPLHSPGGRV